MRKDIISIDEEKLIQLANTGLVKRAKKALDKGDVPIILLDKVATLSATFSDGNVVTWQANQGLVDTLCTCPAPLCRHRVQTVLHYRAEHDNPIIEHHSPHLISPEQLRDYADSQLLTQAQKLCQHGMSATITPALTKVATVALPMATIRFWGGNKLHEATCDCLLKQHCVHVFLAGCAFASLENAPESPQEIQLSKAQLKAYINPQVVTKKTETKENTLNLTPAELTLFTQFLTYGIRGGKVRFERLFDDIQTELAPTKPLWLKDIIDTLYDWVQAYEQRRSDFELTKGVDLIGEYCLRTMARDNPVLQSSALGMGLRQETVISTARFVSLGARVTSENGDFHANIVFGDTTTQTLLVYRKQWQDEAVAERDERAKRISNHRVATGITLSLLATGQLTCQRAKRFANHEVRLNTTRRVYNQAVVVGNWGGFAQPFADTISTLIEKQANRPISAMRGRYAQPNFVVLPITKIIAHGYDPTSQSYVAYVEDSEQCRFVIERHYRAQTPFALDALVHAFSADKAPQWVSGTYRRTGDSFVIYPWAIGGESLYVPDFFSTDNQQLLADSDLLDAPEWQSASPLSSALSALQETMAQAILRGHSSDIKVAFNTHAERLSALGFTQLATLLQNPLDIEQLLYSIALLSLYREM